MYSLQKRVIEQIPLDPLTNKTGDVWHVFLKGDFTKMVYGYKFDGDFSPQGGHYYDSSQLLLDPYAKVSARPCIPFLSIKYILFLVNYLVHIIVEQDGQPFVIFNH